LPNRCAIDNTDNFFFSFTSNSLLTINVSIDNTDLSKMISSVMFSSLLDIVQLVRATTCIGESLVAKRVALYSIALLANALRARFHDADR
jgi:hypothetical protein